MISCYLYQDFSSTLFHMKNIVTITLEIKEFQNDNHFDNDVSALFMLNYLQKSRVTFNF